ncbi:MAG: hypothetical protein IJY27_05850 [Clostridia bacterium]|nr:hypothetical protein [Clostridia bacterium]
MKRALSILIALLLCVSAFGGCSDESLGDGNENAENPPNSTFGFDSYEEMINAFSSKKQNSEGYSIQGLKRLMGEPYAHFVDKVNSDKSFPHPMLEGKPITYRNKGGFSNITFLGNELYNLPWVWYFPTVSTGENFYIAITYLPDVERQRNMTASEVIKELSPKSANIDNLGDQHESIYNKQMKLNDCDVTALVIDHKEDTRDIIFFVYGDLLVLVRCNPEVWTEDWFADLSFDVLEPS